MRCTADFPMRLTTGRRLDSFNTGVQTGGYSSPLRFGETIDSTRGRRPTGRLRGRVVGRFPARRGEGAGAIRLRPSTGPRVHDHALPDEVDTNLLTIDATDLKSGTAEFKASAIRMRDSEWTCT